MKAKAVQISGPGQVAVIEREIRPILPDEARVRVSAVGICTLEKRIYQGKLDLGWPIVAGHEVAGVLEEVGREVAGDFSPGQKVALDMLNRCGQCYWCRRGHTNRCDNRYKGRQGPLGGLSALALVPAREVFPLATEVPAPLGTLCEPLADCLHSLERAGLNHQGPVAVVGLGVMGALHVAALSHLGHTTIGVDPFAAKRELAATLGAGAVASPEEAAEAVLPLSQGRGAQAVIVTAPGSAAMELGLKLLCTGGTLVLYSSYDNGEKHPIDLNQMHYRELTITGTMGRTEVDFQRAVDLISGGGLDLSPLISRTYPVDQAAAAFKASLDPELYRVVITF